MQRAMREHAQKLGWDDSRIHVVEADTGISATSTAGRDAYKRLLTEVAAGHVGIVLSYESTRLSRNCTDWYPLLDLCAYNDCLIADRDGVYDPASPNGRLLLGMKGILSEIELHTLRGRLIAGVQNKAKRGELALALPAGFVRQEDGHVVKDPDLQVQQVIDIVFQTFLTVKSVYKVVRHLREQGLRIPRRHRNAETIWREPTADAVMSILQNPAYAGAFVYGKSRTVHSAVDGHACTRQKRDISEWSIVVRDRYPSYISWETLEKIRTMLRENYAEYERNKSRGIPREGPALLQGLAYCGECGHKMVIQYRGGTRYICCAVRRQTLTPVCQHIPAAPVDQHVTAAFFEALSPIEIDLYEQAMQSRHAQRQEDRKAQERELQRLRYEVQLAR
jgi:DNA invertase Pin-like site-specific DNA recombinase